MAIFKKRMTRTVAIIATIGAMFPLVSGAESLSDRVDNIEQGIDGLEARVASTLLSGGSSPISFSGEARLKMQYHNLGFDAPGWLQADRTYLQSGWEGNENIFRLGMIVRPNRNLVLYSKIGIQHTLVGNRNYRGEPDSYAVDGTLPYQYRHDKVRNSITIHEDLCAGIAVRTVPASFWVRMGNTLWTEASPLTVWKAQPRTFAWEYLPFEVEQPISRYYEYNIARGEKSGRAAWNKRPFNGINVESINLPLDLYANFVYGTFERFDNFEREYVDYAGDLAYADGGLLPFPSKGHGIGESYRHVTHGRLARSKMFGGMTLGLNYVGINYTDDLLYVGKNDPGNDDIFMLLTEFRGDSAVFYKEPWTLSADIRGPITDKLSIHADLAINRLDTTWFIDTIGAGRGAGHYAARRQQPDWYEYKTVSNGDIVPAFYAQVNYNGALPMMLDVAYIAPGFYSPFSFATPMDAFYAYGANMLGAGKFIARGEGSPYTQNMTGASLTFNPTLKGYGHFRLKYGQHFNIQDGRDLLFFPYRLHGADLSSFVHSSFNRWGNGLIDNSISGRGNHKGRLGDEGFTLNSSFNTVHNIRPVAGPGAGGLRADYMSMFEGFVAYDSAQQAYNNWRSRYESYAGADRWRITSFSDNQNRSNVSTVTNYNLSYNEPILVVNPVTFEYDTMGWASDSTTSGWVPESKKYTFNLELDAAYDISPFVGYKRDLFVGGYAGINGISRSELQLLAFNDKGDNTLLWSFYLRLEPAIAVTRNFYVLGLFGYENWRSQASWMMVNLGRAVDGVRPITGVLNPTATQVSSAISKDNFVQVPIDYRDMAFGIGFDWNMLLRTGLHARAKWMSREDRGLNDKYKEWGLDASDVSRTNDWSSPVFSLELKTWF